MKVKNQEDPKDFELDDDPDSLEYLSDIERMEVGLENSESEVKFRPDLESDDYWFELKRKKGKESATCR